MKKILMILIAIIVSVQLSSAQTYAVTGKVTGFNKFPLKNIKVRAKKAKTATITDENGNFLIVSFPKDVLIFEAKSCIKQTYRISNQKDSVKVNMVFKNTEESKEYAVGYGIISEKDLTYGISNLNNDNNNFNIYNNIYELLRGKFPDVKVYDDNSIVIRGIISINGPSRALLVVDGTVVNSIGWLSPSSVKSIDILKDAATSIYGTQGAGGVVLITTKKGN
jgi:TonB-dependent SusC/RagA subfamily outer membrane receptor